MKIGLVSLMSEFHDPELVNRASDPIIAALKESFEINEIESHRIPESPFPMVLIKTGGTEHQFRQLAHLFEASAKPVTILSTGSNNSLPAAMEILSWLNNNGYKNNLLLHGDIDLIKKGVEKRAADIQILHHLYHTRIGVIGRPSDWLIASEVDYENMMLRWHTELMEIPLTEVFEAVAGVTDKEATAALLLLPTPLYQKDVAPASILKALKIYLALKQLIAYHHITALTLRCFDIVKTLESTGCMALAMLNDDGIVAGCEGDVPALLTMLINYFITGRPSFMANPSRVDTQKNTLTLAHCTVPMSIVDSFGFRTHFESGIGVGIAGKFHSETPITVSKIGGPELKQFYVAEGTISHHVISEDLCRTQFTIKMDGNVQYYIKNPLGNHHIFSTGRIARRFNEVMNMVNALPVPKE